MSSSIFYAVFLVAAVALSMVAVSVWEIFFAWLDKRQLLKDMESAAKEMQGEYTYDATKTVTTSNVGYEITGDMKVRWCDNEWFEKEWAKQSNAEKAFDAVAFDDEVNKKPAKDLDLQDAEQEAYEQTGLTDAQQYEFVLADIQEYLGEKKTNRAKVNRKLKVGPEYLKHVLNGNRKLSYNAFAKLADLLYVDPMVPLFTAMKRYLRAAPKK